MAKMLHVKYHTEGCEIGQAHPGEWIDVRAAEEVDLVEGGAYLIPLGFSCRLPFGYEAIMAPRSGSFRKYGFIQTNSIGVIDEKYGGNDDQWMLAVYATRHAVIPKGDRIAQFRIQEIQPEIVIIPVDDLGDNNRGGFGSTGRS